MNLTLTYHKSAVKFLSKQDAHNRQRIYAALEGLKRIPPAGDITKLKGTTNQYRLRVGTFRIIYQINFQEYVVYILAIDNLGDIY
ncbi:type II toxin-antitoxin system RelE family toxin [Paenibacillus jiagnxiensis]|uniref:type II toxin-antitoxin system RelE family toxin n=1 Tax=Paenibacillus jiagnxiensis TaxID=3228926 RepID=UPI0033B7DD81